MKLPTPKNAQEAALQIRVIERAKAIAEELKHGGEYYAVQQNSQPGIYGMYKRSGSTKADTVYLIDLIADTCECPFHAENHYCKHGIALNLHLDAIAQEEADEEQAERYEREMRDAELESTGCDPFAEF